MRKLSLTVAATAGCLNAPVNCQLATAIARVLNTEPQHTVIYTTLITKHAPSPVLAPVTITLLKPLEDPNYPTDGVLVTGTAISGNKTSQLVWTLSGNVPLGYDLTFPPLPLGATTTLTKSYTTSESHSSTYRNLVLGYGRYDYFTTAQIIFVEGVGPAYPATIIRTGYTSVNATQIGGNEVVGFSHTASATMSYWRTTTMVLVLPDPTQA